MTKTLLFIFASFFLFHGTPANAGEAGTVLCQNVEWQLVGSKTNVYMDDASSGKECIEKFRNFIIQMQSLVHQSLQRDDHGVFETMDDFGNRVNCTWQISADAAPIPDSLISKLGETYKGGLEALKNHETKRELQEFSHKTIDVLCEKPTS